MIIILKLLLFKMKKRELSNIFSVFFFNLPFLLIQNLIESSTNKSFVTSVLKIKENIFYLKKCILSSALMLGLLFNSIDVVGQSGRSKTAYGSANESGRTVGQSANITSNILQDERLINKKTLTNNDCQISACEASHDSLNKNNKFSNINKAVSNIPVDKPAYIYDWSPINDQSSTTLS